MRGKIKEELGDHLNGACLTAGSDCLVLGIQGDWYFLLDEFNVFGILRKGEVEITDEEKPDFWIERNGRTVPEEWHWENFLSLQGCPYDEWNEIWFITQFAKGFSKFNLPELPQPFNKANDIDYKYQIVKNYLQIAEDFDNLIEPEPISWGYLFYRFENDLSSIRWADGKQIPFKKVLISGESSGFDVLKGLIYEIGSSFQRLKPSVDRELLDGIRNRILFSIWAIFGTKEFEVYKLVYDKHSESDYLLQYGTEHYFTLSFELLT
ncbi:hypothetical protein [Pedobacter caeni]|uniref:Uncharacterized protein n=1 Tax=Pedobacter caeni TaxID=288992 RepID=A0A1M4UAE1_9SPHI|nr:hypothetical protein [Pedobacter caeni]SHE53567.1 hypothetical protein SAMN04488522_101484 [Pedobacter caeni]